MIDEQMRAAGYLRLGEIAERLSLHPERVRRWVAAGLPCERVGRLIWIRPQDLAGRVPQFVIDSMGDGK